MRVTREWYAMISLISRHGDLLSIGVKSWHSKQVNFRHVSVSDISIISQHRDEDVARRGGVYCTLGVAR